MFTGCALDPQTIHEHINHPSNTLNMESNTHDAMDKHLAWGIEAKFSGSQVNFSCFDWDFEFTYRIVQVLLSSCSTGLGVAHCTVAGR